jgi:nucleoside phosphorylase
MGQAEATALATEVALVWKPRVVLMVGIAASTRPGEVKLGDVVVARSIYYYEHGKITAQGISPQPEMIPADAGLLKHYAGLPEWNGAVLTSRPGNTDARPRVHLGVIASGDKVVAHAPARDAITAGQRKVLALEMEGYGFSRALWLNAERTPHLVIRGISDEGCEQKNDDWHYYAAASAAGFAKHFLLDRPLEQGESSTPSTEAAAGLGVGTSQWVSSSVEKPPEPPARDAPALAQQRGPTPLASSSPQPPVASAQPSTKQAEAKSRKGQATSFWALVVVITGVLFLRQLSLSNSPSAQTKPPAEVGFQPAPKPPADKQPKPAPKPIPIKPAPPSQPPPREKALATINDFRQKHGVTLMPETVKPVPLYELPKGMLGYVEPTAFPSLKRAMIGRTATARSFELHKAIDGAVFLVGYVKRETLEGIERGRPIDEALIVANPAEPRTTPVSIPISRIQNAYFAVAPDAVEVLALKLGANPVP